MCVVSLFEYIEYSNTCYLNSAAFSLFSSIYLQFSNVESISRIRTNYKMEKLTIPSESDFSVKYCIEIFQVRLIF